MSATEPVDSHEKNRFLEIHESKLKLICKKIQIADSFLNIFRHLSISPLVFENVAKIKQSFLTSALNT